MKKDIIAYFTLLILSFSAPLFTASSQNNEVKRIPKINADHVQQTYTNYDRGFWITAEATGGYSCRISHKNGAFTELSATGGYRLNDYLRLGVGFGARIYIANHNLRYRHEIWSFPLFFDVRGNFIRTDNRSVVPYYSLDIGGAFRDGFMIRPTVGLRIGQSRSAMLVGLSYLGQETKSFRIADNSEKVPFNTFLNFICLRIGYEF